MIELSPEEIKKIQISLLRRFSTFCKRNRLEWFVWAGTLLGTIRHGGFIPWDDDIDIAMPRSDYNKLIDLCRNGNSIIGADFLCLELDNSYVFPFGKLTEKNTLLIEKNSKKTKYGIFIDVFPIDKIDGNHDTQQKAIRKAKFWFIMLDLNLQRGIIRIDSSKRMIMQLLIRPLSHLFSCKFLVQKVHKNAIHFANNAGINNAILTHSVLTKTVFVDDDLFPSIIMKFESVDVLVPRNYKKILTLQYGDFMQMPPESERKARHKMTAFLIE